MNAETFARQGMALAQQNRLAEALVLFDRSLQLNPDDGRMHHNRGVILHQLGRVGEAVASYDRALRADPHDAGTLYNRGNALVQLRRMDEAAASYERSLKRDPGNVQALMNRGYTLMHLERPDEALANYQKARTLKPGLVEAHYNLGLILMKLNRAEEAGTSFDAALRLQPGHAAAWNDRGSALMTLARIDDALASFEQALRAKPDFAEAWYNRGLALTKRNRLEDAAASFARALQIRPGHDAALAQKAWVQAKMCDWSSRASDVELLKRADGAEPFAMLSLVDDPQSQLAAARSWARQFPAAPALPFTAKVRPQRLRIGYFSCEFRNHAMMHLMAGVFARHDKDRFEIHMFALEPAADAMRQRAIAAADHFHDVSGKSDADIVALARAQGLDIAVDLLGYTRGARTEIFARRLAPIQASYLGFPGTLGADFIDHTIADRFVLPESEQAAFTEKAVYLSPTYLGTDNQSAISPRVFSRAELGLPENGFVFCCFNNSYKISPREFDIWMRLLARVSGSVLWLLQDNAQTAANLAREARARGIDPTRIVYAGRVSREEHLARHANADLFLDTFLYTAHTTAVDALWTGLPLVTVPGCSFAARVAAGTLHAIGLPELIAADDAAYEQLAFELATQPERLAALKAKLAANRLTTPLFDTDGFTREMEAGFDRMFAQRLPA